MVLVFYQMDLTGRIGIVTGPGRGLGKAIAIALAKTGANLVVTARTESRISETAKEIEEKGRSVPAVQADG